MRLVHGPRATRLLWPLQTPWPESGNPPGPYSRSGPSLLSARGPLPRCSLVAPPLRLVAPHAWRAPASRAGAPQVLRHAAQPRVYLGAHVRRHGLPGGALRGVPAQQQARHLLQHPHGHALPPADGASRHATPPAPSINACPLPGPEDIRNTRGHGDCHRGRCV